MYRVLVVSTPCYSPMVGRDHQCSAVRYVLPSRPIDKRQYSIGILYVITIPLFSHRARESHVHSNTTADKGASKLLILNSNGYTGLSPDNPLAEEFIDRTVAG